MSCVWDLDVFFCMIVVWLSRSSFTAELTVPHRSSSSPLISAQTVTYYQGVVNNLEDAHESIYTAISTALKESKPVYISISCNLLAITHPTFCQEHVPFSLALKVSNKLGLEVVVAAAAEFLNKGVKPVMVEGPKLQVAKASDAFVELADASGFAVAVMPSAKGLVPEHHPHFIGLEHLRDRKIVGHSTWLNKDKNCTEIHDPGSPWCHALEILYNIWIPLDV